MPGFYEALGISNYNPNSDYRSWRDALENRVDEIEGFRSHKKSPNYGMLQDGYIETDEARGLAHYILGHHNGAEVLAIYNDLLATKNGHSDSEVYKETIHRAETRMEARDGQSGVKHDNPMRWLKDGNKETVVS